MKALALVLFLALFASTLRASIDPPALSSLTLTATGATLTAQSAYREGFSVQLIGITGTVAVNVEASLDNVNWSKVNVFNIASTAASLTMTANGLYQGTAAAGVKSLRVKAASISSGVVGVVFSWGTGASPQTVPANPTGAGDASAANQSTQIGLAQKLTGTAADTFGIAASVTGGSKANFSNANGFNFLSATVLTGVSPNADSALSLTWAAGVATGPIFVDLNCSGATGMNYMITNAAATPTGFVANAALWGYQPCGQISQIPLEVNGANTPHLHVAAVTLSFTSESVGVVTKQRP